MIQGTPGLSSLVQDPPPSPLHYLLQVPHPHFGRGKLRLLGRRPTSDDAPSHISVLTVLKEQAADDGAFLMSRASRKTFTEPWEWACLRCGHSHRPGPLRGAAGGIPSTVAQPEREALGGGWAEGPESLRDLPCPRPRENSDARRGLRGPVRDVIGQ